MIAHCAYGYTSNLSLEAMDEDDVLRRVAQPRRGPDARARLAAPARRPEALRVEEREVAHGLEFADANRRGFWEVRGYHVHAEPFAEERYSYQEGARAELEPYGLRRRTA